MNRIFQEARPSKYAGVIVDHHRPDTGELWLARAQGFMIALVLLGVVWFLSEGVITR